MSTKICVIGAGYWGKNHIKSLSKLNSLRGIVEIKSNVLDSILYKYPEIKIHSDIQNALLEDYDGFVIATPAKTHFGIAKTLIKKQKTFLLRSP